MDIDYYKEQLTKEEIRIGCYLTLANGKDAELIKQENELKMAKAQIEELSQRVSELEPLAERAAFLEHRAAPVIKFENSIFGRATKKLIRLFRH